LNETHHEERPVERLSFRERFEVRRAVYNGSAVKNPALAAAAVARASQRNARPRRWSRRWFRSFLLDPIDLPTYVVFSVVLLVVWPSVLAVEILAGGFILIGLMTRRRIRRKAHQAFEVNQRLLEKARPRDTTDPLASK
jgi:hypothetical protein